MVDMIPALETYHLISLREPLLPRKSKLPTVLGVPSHL